MSLVKMYLHGQLLPIRFSRYMFTYVKYEFKRINTRQTPLIDPSNIGRALNRCLNSQICAQMHRNKLRANSK
jgi:hypothetical protein